MSAPNDAFFAHVQSLPGFAELNLSEADTRVYLIDPVLRALGYISVGDIRREVAVPATKEFLDYGLYADGKAQAIVEAKAIRHQVSDGAAAQCVQYAAVLGVRWCIITNGIIWAIYNAHAGGPLSDKRVATVRLDGDEPSIVEAWEVLSLFSKESLARSNPLIRLLAERVILDELSRPDSPAVTALRKAVKDRFGERVTAQTVVDAIEKLRNRQSSIPVAESPETSAVSEPQPAQQARTRQSDQPREGERVRLRQIVLKPDGSRVTLRDMLEAGVLPPDAALESKSRGVTFVARLSGESVEMGGVTYGNLSEAASAAAEANRNGWYFWKYQGELLNDIRRRLADKLAAEASSTA